MTIEEVMQLASQLPEACKFRFDFSVVDVQAWIVHRNGTYYMPRNGTIEQQLQDCITVSKVYWKLPGDQNDFQFMFPRFKSDCSSVTDEEYTSLPQ